MCERAPASFAERVCGYPINASVRRRGYEQHGPAALPIGPQHWFMDSTRSTDGHSSTSRDQNSGRQREHSRYLAKFHFIALPSSGSAHARLRNTSPLVIYFTGLFLTVITVACSKHAASTG